MARPGTLCATPPGISDLPIWTTLGELEKYELALDGVCPNDDGIQFVGNGPISPRTFSSLRLEDIFLSPRAQLLRSGVAADSPALKGISVRTRESASPMIAVAIIYAVTR